MIDLKKNSIAVTLLLFIAAAGIPHRPAAAMQLRLTTASQAEAEYPNNPAVILAKARIISVHSRTVLVKSEVIESELQKRADFQQAGLLLTKDPRAADLIVDVRRANFTTEYPYVVIDSKTKLIVASEKVNSLFGTAAGKIAKGFMKQVLQARKVASP
jgi:hypothetical protein